MANWLTKLSKPLTKSFSKVTTKLSKGYRKADVALGGYLPGGVKPKITVKDIPKIKAPSTKVITYTEAVKKAQPISKPRSKTITYTQAKKVLKEVSKPTPPRKTFAEATGAERTLQKIQVVQTRISEGIRPEERRARQAVEQLDRTHLTAVEKYNRDMTQFGKDVSSFSKKYDKELSQKDYSAAIKTQQRLQQRQASLENRELALGTYEGRRASLVAAHEVKRKKVPKIVRVAQGAWVGVLQTPLGLASLGIGLATKPKKTVKGVALGIEDLPRQIKAKPIETLSELGGSAALMYLGGAALGAGKATPKVSQSISSQSAVRVGKTPTGVSLWKVKTKVKTIVKHPKTGKTLKVLDTRTFSDVITAQTKSGAIKAVSKTMGATIKKKGIILGAEPKLKLTADITKAKGKMTFEQTSIDKLMKGYGGGKIQEIGKLKIIKAPKATKVKIKTKLGKKYEALTNIYSKEIGVRKKVIFDIRTKPKAIRVIKGKEYVYKYKALSDIYGKKGTKQILKSQELGIAKAFIPEEVGVKYFDVNGKVRYVKTKIPKAKPYKPFSKVKSPQLQKLVKPLMTQKQAAKMGAGTLAKDIAKTRVKPIIISKVTPLSRVVQVMAPVGLSAMKQRARVKQVPRFRVKGLQKINQILGPMTKTKTRVRYAPMTKLSQTISQSLKQKVAVVQVPRAAQTLVPRAPRAPTYGVPTIILPPFIRKETTTEKRRRKRIAAQLKKQRRAYQASVGAVVLNIRAPRVTKKRFTGFGLRPIISRKKSKKKKESAYLKRIRKAFR